MNILILGSGGREHAIAWTIAQSPSRNKIYCAPGNAGTAAIAENVPISPVDFPALIAFARTRGIDLTIVGPETPLCDGIVDAFESQELVILGPKRYAAQLESSKSFAKAFMQRHGIPTAQYELFNRAEIVACKNYIERAALPLVVKANGLAAGKGVLICTTREEALDAIEQIFTRNVFGGAGNTVVVEEFMRGEEASVFALCDGERYVTFAPAQDHKRIGDGDTGKNTGGMGAFAPATIVDAAALDFVKTKIIERVLNGMRREGCPYTGFLYCGLMMTDAGPKVVEFNCRLGDPEAQVVLPLIDYDFAELCLQAAQKNLSLKDVPQKDGHAVCVVLASGGYPDSYPTGKEISGLDNFNAYGNIVVFHAGTKYMNDRIVTSGGRVLGVTAIGEGKTLLETIDSAYSAVEKISFEGMYFRQDIGKKGIKFISTTTSN